MPSILVSLTIQIYGLYFGVAWHKFAQQGGLQGGMTTYLCADYKFDNPADIRSNATVDCHHIVDYQIVELLRKSCGLIVKPTSSIDSER